MATTPHQAAKNAIKAYLDNRAATDALFAVNYAKKSKNLEECFRYIMGEARHRGTAVYMTDAEVFGLAVHYYDEDNIEIKPIGAMTARVSAPKVELTEEEKATAREAARKRYEELCVAEEAERAAKRKKAEAERKKAEAEQRKQQQKITVPTLFDFDEL